jgi:5,10-methylenetetrahydrofolate reductase
MFKLYRAQGWFSRTVGGVERGVKTPLLGCAMCGQCIVRTCQMSCPMRCPKSLRNGPCGGSHNGYCEVVPTMRCTWDEAWTKAERRSQIPRLMKIQPLIDWRLEGTPAWLNVVKGIISIDGHPKDAWNIPIAQPATEPRAGTLLEQCLRAGEFVVTAEIVPPRVPDFKVIQKRVDALKGRVHGVNVTDTAAATVKMPSWAICSFLIQNGIEPIFQLGCRDRNRLALQSDLLGAYACGVRNVFAVSGDYVTVGDHPQARPVHDVDAIQLLAIFHRMRHEGKLASGSDLRDSAKAEPFKPKLFLGCAAHPTADPVKGQVMRVLKKALAGADFVQTQVVFDIERFRQFMAMAHDEGLTKHVKILAGIMPVKSVKAFEFMKTVPGIRVPDALIKRLDAAANKEEEGLAIALELIEAVRATPGVAGVHLMAPYWEPAVPVLLDRAKLGVKKTVAVAAPPLEAAVYHPNP